MKLPVGQIDKTVYVNNLQDKLKLRKLLFVISLLLVPIAIIFMETFGSELTKPETSRSITEPVAYVNTGTGTGSAFLTGPSTLITARHVVEQLNIGDEVELIFMFMKPQLTTSATLLWKESSPNFSYEKDFAVLRLSNKSAFPDDMPVLSIGDSDIIIEGDDIIAVGYPRGMASVTKGVISSTSIMEANSVYELIKVDLQIHKGNSGGPIILESTEEVIGIAAAGMEREFKGMNFATKINKLVELCEKDGIDIYE